MGAQRIPCGWWVHKLGRKWSDILVQSPLQFSQGLGVAIVNAHIGEVGENEAEKAGRQSQ